MSESETRRRTPSRGAEANRGDFTRSGGVCIGPRRVGGQQRIRATTASNHAGAAGAR